MHNLTCLDEVKLTSHSIMWHPTWLLRWSCAICWVKIQSSFIQVFILNFYYKDLLCFYSLTFSIFFFFSFQNQTEHKSVWKPLLILGILKAMPFNILGWDYFPRWNDLAHAECDRVGLNSSPFCPIFHDFNLESLSCEDRVNELLHFSFFFLGGTINSK